MKPDDDRARLPTAERPFRVLLLSGSNRRQYNCPGVDSKSRSLIFRMADRLPKAWEIDCEDLGNVYGRARIQSCNACVSTSMALCVWPCNCYEKSNKDEPDQAEDLLHETSVLADFDAWSDRFADFVARKGKVQPGRWRAFGYEPPTHRIADWKLKWRELRMKVGRAAEPSSPAEQHRLGLIAMRPSAPAAVKARSCANDGVAVARTSLASRGVAAGADFARSAPPRRCASSRTARKIPRHRGRRVAEARSVEAGRKGHRDRHLNGKGY